jgi:WD40 repeat protein
VTDSLPYKGDEPMAGRIATQRDFGRELTLARQRAGLTVRQVARAAGLPASTVGDYFSGRHLPPPSQAGLLERVLRACGETDQSRVVDWSRALSRARRTPGRRAVGASAPYRGLSNFEPEDAAFFFGRAEVTERLLALATGARPGTGVAVSLVGVPLAVVGPSGSGKSSLLRAGLIPRLLAERAYSCKDSDDAGQDVHARPLALFSPAANPMAGLAAELSLLTAAGPEVRSAGSDLEAALCRDPASAAELRLGGPVIVVDQFEAVFTDCLDEDRRQAFISAICALSGPAVVVLALRADFYDRALRYPELARVLQERQVVLEPMSKAELRCAIIEPARLQRLDVEDGLVEILLRDLAPRTVVSSIPDAAHEAGALPLLSHALLATWEHSHGGKLTVADYEASGGIKDAIARTAEAVYARLADEQRDTARRLFLRLVHVADDAPETRAVVQLGELHDWPQDGTSAEDLLGSFVDERLITADADTAQITHDALLTAWPRLRSWIDMGRENLRTGRRISLAAQAWAQAEQDSAALLRGTQLAVARDWAADADNRAGLGRRASEFVDASIAHEAMRQQAARHRTRRLRRMVAALAALALATCGLAAYSFQQRQAANSARDRAAAARDDAESREVAIEADQIRGQNVSLAAQLSLASYRIAPTSEARSSLLESSGTAAAAGLTDSPGPVQSISLSPDHRWLAVTAADGTLRLWDVTRPGHPVPVGVPLVQASDMPLYSAAFSPNGQILAAAGAGKTVSLWDVGEPHHPIQIGTPLTGPTGTVYSVAFSPNGRILAAGSADHTVRIWDVSVPRKPVPLATLTGSAGYIESVAFSPDGATLAAGSTDDTVRLWNVSDPARPFGLGKPLAGPAATVSSVAFSPDGTMLAAGSQDNKIWLWNVARPGRAVQAGPPLTGATDWVNAVSFSPGGTAIAAGGSDNSVLVWNLTTRTMMTRLPHPQPVTSLAWDGAGHLITGDADGIVRNWTLPSPVLLAGSPVNSVAFSPGGTLLAVASRDLELWSPVTRERLAAVTVPGTFVDAVAFAPRGNLLAAGYGNGMVQLWRAVGRTLVRVGRPVSGSARGLVESVAFSPDGAVLAEGGDDGAIRLWSIANATSLRPLATVHDSGIYYVFSVAFSPDHRILAAASSDNLTRLWSITDPDHPSLLGKPLAGLASYAISVAFSPDSRTIAVGSADKTIRLWNVTDPVRPVLLGHPLTGPVGYVYSVVFSPNGGILAAGATDGTVWLWNLQHLARPALLATLTGPTGQVYSVAFGRGGNSLAAGSADGTTRLWDTRTRTAAVDICATLGQPLSKGEWKVDIPGLTYKPSCSRSH